MNKILDCNISKLMDAATVWKNRFETIIKISYFRGIDAKPHTLLFEINPEWNPKEDYAFEILNSFSQTYKRSVGKRAKPVRVGNRAELIETCINPDPEFPDVYITEWRFFVKLDDLYFEKQFNDLSGDFIFIDFPIEFKKDYSRNRIIDWDYDYFFSQVTPESERVLYSMKINKCEKSEQGRKKAVVITEDNTNLFPELNINHLKIIAKRWVDKYEQRGVKFSKILLFRYASDYFGAEVPVKYVIVFDITHYKPIQGPEAQASMEEHIKWVAESSSLPHDPYNDFINRDIGYNSIIIKGIPERFSYSDFGIVYNPPRENFEKEWKIIPLCCEETLPVMVRVEEGGVELYNETPVLKHKESASTINELETQLNELLKQYCPELEHFYNGWLEHLSELGIKRNLATEIELKDKAVEYYEYDTEVYPYKFLCKSHIEKNSHYSHTSKGKRTTIGRILQQIVKEELKSICNYKGIDITIKTLAAFHDKLK